MNTTAERLDNIIKDRVECLVRHSQEIDDPELSKWILNYVRDFCFDLDTSPEPIVWLMRLL